MAGLNRKDKRREQHSSKLLHNVKVENVKETKKDNSKQSSFSKKIEHIYTRKYKQLMIIPNIVLFLSIAVLFFNLFTTGEFIHKGVAIQGGVAITIINPDLQNNEVKDFLKQTFPKADIETRTLSGSGSQIGLIIEVSGATSEELQNALISQYKLTKDEYTVEVTGSTLGKSFYRQLIIAIIIAFILMGIVVYVYYRVLVPSFAIILSAFSGMITTLAIVSLFGMNLTPASIAAFLMLIGFSVDTDILLTTRVLKGKEGSVDDKIFSAIKTGLTMSAAAVASVTVTLIFTHSEVIKQIMTILLIGLIFDLIYTWIQNVGILKIYLEKKGELKYE